MASMTDQQLAALTREEALALVPEYVWREVVRLDVASGTGYVVSDRAVAWIEDGDNCVILHKAGFGRATNGTRP